MGRQHGNSLLIFFFACICTPTSSHLTSTRHDEQAGCKTVNCGMGTCRETPGLALGFVCDCYSGWSMPQAAGVTIWPSCIVPNCTFIPQCGGKPPLAPLPPPPPLFQPAMNLSLPCMFVWCGDGECAASGSSHTCQCPEGSANLMGLPTLACLQQCNLGADCNLGFGPQATPSPPPPPVKSSASPGTGKSPPPSPSAPPQNGLAAAPNCSRNYRALSWMMMLLAVIVVSWI